MGSFVYAIPGNEPVTEKKIREVGLADIFEGMMPNFSQRHTAAGPGGGDRMLICIGDDARQLYYKPEEQTWQEGMNGKFHVGFINNEKPTEEILRRKRQLAGHEVELGDGGKWLIPVARIITGGSALPQTLVLGKNGEVLTEELPRYAQFGAMAEQLWEDFQIENKWKEGKLKINVGGRMNFAIEALAWNYRIGADEVNMLKLLTTENLSEIMAVIIDVPTLVEVIKEMEAEKKNTGTDTAGG